jgi:hypothetical protein
MLSLSPISQQMVPSIRRSKVCFTSMYIIRYLMPERRCNSYCVGHCHLIPAHRRAEIAYRHVASPLVVDSKDIENDLLKPAVRGTTGILRAATSANTVKAVVITSSFGAAADLSKGFRPGYTYTTVCLLRLIENRV